MLSYQLSRDSRLVFLAKNLSLIVGRHAYVLQYERVSKWVNEKVGEDMEGRPTIFAHTSLLLMHVCFCVSNFVEETSWHRLFVVREIS